MTADNASAITTRRPMGIETEFGVVHSDDELRGRSGSSASVRLSHYAVSSYALLVDSDRERVRWDYGDETPLRDARGFEMQRAAAHPTQLTDQVRDAHVPSVDLDHAVALGDEIPRDLDDAATIHMAERLAISNSVLRNGARLYVDHAHPEYSSPEVMTAREGVLYDRAGEEIARAAMAAVEGADGVPDVALYKNNTDGKGQSYGTHENYCVDRDIPFSRICDVLIPFFATRQILVGAGRVGIGPRGEEAGFQISSRADFFEATVGLETTLNRPIVNSRDEPHSDAGRFRRLHVIVGDANQYESSTFLKLAVTSLVLSVLEYEQRTGETFLPDIDLIDPVHALHDISHDLTLDRRYDTVQGESLTAIEIQQRYRAAVRDALDAAGATADAETAEALDLWASLLDALESDWAAAAQHIEWVGKHALLEQFRARHGLEWDDPRLTALDIQFSDLRADRSLYMKLKRAGRVAVRLSDSEVAEAVTHPPLDTRAYVRGQLVRHHRGALDSAGWDAVSLAHEGAALTCRFADPTYGSHEWCARHGVDPTGDLAEFVLALQSIS